MDILQLLNSLSTFIFSPSLWTDLFREQVGKVFWEWGRNEIYLALWSHERYPCVTSESVTDAHLSPICTLVLGNHLHTWQCFHTESGSSTETKFWAEKLPFSTWLHFYPNYKPVCVRICQRVCLIKLYSTDSILSAMKSKMLCQSYLKGDGGLKVISQNNVGNEKLSLIMVHNWRLFPFPRQWFWQLNLLKSFISKKINCTLKKWIGIKYSVEAKRGYSKCYFSNIGFVIKWRKFKILKKYKMLKCALYGKNYCFISKNCYRCMHSLP